MNIVLGSIVKSLAGRDKNSFYVAVGMENGFVYIVDGKERKLEKPKKKNIIHIAPTKKVVELDGVTNKKIKRLIMEFTTQDSNRQTV